jgi:hypothetical protein
MKTMGLDGKTNFFEQRVAEYFHSSAISMTENDWNFENVDF